MLIGRTSALKQLSSQFRWNLRSTQLATKQKNRNLCFRITVERRNDYVTDPNTNGHYGLGAVIRAFCSDGGFVALSCHSRLEIRSSGSERLLIPRADADEKFVYFRCAGQTRLMLMQPLFPPRSDQAAQRFAAMQHTFPRAVIQHGQKRQNPNRSFAAPATDVSHAGLTRH